ncbi:MAG: hypothetical protein EXS15_08795 [Phycisphaerales bacterium]|nr:hypothetical protein [Phycisphaerales bacterium]
MISPATKMDVVISILVRHSKAYFIHSHSIRTIQSGLIKIPVTCTSMTSAPKMIEKWLRHYNEIRTHSSLG